MSVRASNAVARLLAHPAGFLVFNAFTVCWFTVPVAAGWLLDGLRGAFFALVLASYLDVVTWFGGVTQFTLAYQNQKASAKLDETLAALLQLARNDQTDNDALIAQGEALTLAMREIKTLVADRDASRT